MMSFLPNLQKIYLDYRGVCIIFLPFWCGADNWAATVQRGANQHQRVGNWHLGGCSGILDSWCCVSENIAEYWCRKSAKSCYYTHLQCPLSYFSKTTVADPKSQTSEWDQQLPTLLQWSQQQSCAAGQISGSRTRHNFTLFLTTTDNKRLIVSARWQQQFTKS